MPPWAARPAKQVGEPAGGSLSVDIYKGLATVFLPIAVSHQFIFLIQSINVHVVY